MSVQLAGATPASKAQAAWIFQVVHISKSETLAEHSANPDVPNSVNCATQLEELMGPIITAPPPSHVKLPP
jgi:hypothetical protein